MIRASVDRSQLG